MFAQHVVAATGTREIYNQPWNNVGLNSACPLICGVFFSQYLYRIPSQLGVCECGGLTVCIDLRHLIQRT